MNAEPLVPRAIFAPIPLDASFPAALADAVLPTDILPVEGFGKLAEFWGTMGQGTPWRPALLLRVTLPVVPEPRLAGFAVTSAIAAYGVPDSIGVSGQWVEIGGRVLDSAGQPIAAAWVELQAPPGQRLRTTATDPDGRFAFRRLRPGTYHLRTRAPGHGDTGADIDVPSGSGTYDLQF
jgi:hypothetical protein